MTTGVTSVFVVDDHPVVVQGITALVDGDGSLEVVGAAETLREALSVVRALRPDVVLLDVRLPDTDAVTAVRALARASGRSRVVLFTADPSHPYVRPAREAGAVAVVAKDTRPAELREVIRRAAAGEPVETDAPEPLLTARQQDVLVRVATGMTSGEIAVELGLQLATVKTYWQEAMQRLGVRNRAEAIATAYRRGLL